jgi:hypothetical protein
LSKASTLVLVSLFIRLAIKGCTDGELSDELFSGLHREDVDVGRIRVFFRLERHLDDLLFRIKIGRTHIGLNYPEDHTANFVIDSHISYSRL